MKKVLLCDDSAFIRKRVKSILAEFNFDFFEAADGDEALTLVEKEKVDLIILDMLMPKITGQQVLLELNKRGNNVPVIALSADIQDSTKNFCIENGAFAFLNKPPKNEELISKVKEALNI